jgi:hypothetical protein
MFTHIYPRFLSWNWTKAKQFFLIYITCFYGQSHLSAQVYQQQFGSTSITSKPYVGPPGIANSVISNSSWTTSAAAFGGLSGSSGAGLSLSNSSGTPSFTLTFSIQTGFQLTLNSFDFWRIRSSTGAQNWAISINGVSAATGSLATTGANTGNSSFLAGNNQLSGTVTMVITFSGASGSGTCRIDDFTLYGSVQTVSTNSQTADIIRHSSFTEPSLINYLLYADTSSITLINSLEVAKFTLRDSGPSADADATSCELNQITFQTTANIFKKVALYLGGTKLAESTSNDTLIQFLSLTSLIAPDNGTIDFSLRVTFLQTQIDRRQFSFKVVSANSAGSGFATSNAGAAQSSTASNLNTIQVNASKLIFTQQPTQVNTNENISPAISVAVVDTFGNKDIDFLSSLTLSSTGTLNVGSTLTINPSEGMGIFPSISFSTAATAKVVQVNASGLQGTGNSNSFDIVSYLPRGSIAFVHYQADAPDAFTIVVLKDIIGSQQIVFTDNAWTSTNGPLATNESSIVWTTPTNGIMEGTTITFTASVGSSTLISPTGNGTCTGSINGLSASGDQVLIYQGSNTIPYFIAAMNFGSNGNWLQSGTTNTNTSYLPSGLVNQVSAISMQGTQENGYYSKMQQGPENMLASFLNNSLNWFQHTDLSLLSIPSFGFNLQGKKLSLSAHSFVSNLYFNENDTLHIGSNQLTISGALSGLGSFSLTDSSEVIINGITNNFRCLKGANTLKNLTISANGSLTLADTLQVGANGQLVLGNNAQLETGGFLVLGSNELGSARIAPLPASASIIGKVTIERFVKGGLGKRKYRYLSVPLINSANFANGWQKQIHITGSGAGGIQCSVGNAGLVNSKGFDLSATNLPSVFTFEESLAIPSASIGGSSVFTNAWKSILSTTDTMVCGKGYNVFVRGNRNQGCSLLTQPNTIPDDVILKATGFVKTGDFTFSLSYNPSNGDGWNLLGNPYPSEIDWDAATGWTKSMVGNTIYVYNPSQQNFAAYNSSSGGVNGGARYIPSGTAFFVKATGTNAQGLNLSCTEMVKSTHGFSPLLKQNKLQKIAISLMDNLGATDETILSFSPEANDEFDNATDILKWKNPGNLNVYSLTPNGISCALNQRKQITESEEKNIPLAIFTSDTGWFQMNLQSFGLPYFYEVYILDNYLSKEYLVTDLHQSISFQVNVDSNSFGLNRFSIKIANKRPHSSGFGSTTTPQERFMVYPNPFQNILDWNGTQEASIDLMEIGGKILLHKEVLPTGEINLGEFKDGVYLLRVQFNSGQTKFIKLLKSERSASW